MGFPWTILIASSYIFVNDNDAMSVESEVSKLKVEHLEIQLDGKLGDTSIENFQNEKAKQPGINGTFKAIEDM